MVIKINRQSVCMADDMDDHSITYSINASTKYSHVFQDLIKQKYFPKVAGNDVVWTLYCGEDDLISWKTKVNKMYSRFITEEPTILSVKRWNTSSVNFRYYSPPIKRAQHIFELFDGSKFNIWHEGFMEEYKTYCIPQSVEEDWRKTFLK